MARRKKKTTKAVARDNVTLDSVFTGIANAIREKAETSDPIYPRNMGNAIRGIKGVNEAALPEANLPAVFQDIANAIRACGITGTMTASQMASKISDIVLPQPTRVTYTQASELSDWSYDIVGEIAGSSTDPYYTSQIPNVEYSNTISIGDNVTSIGDYAFYQCTNLTGVTIPASVTSIGDRAFYKCRVSSITIPNNVTSIGQSAFYNCPVTSITIPDSVTTIGASVFGECNSMRTVIIGNGITSIPSGAFNGCTFLSSVTIGNHVTTIGNSAFYNGGFSSITLPNSVTSIAQAAFLSCKKLTSIIMGSNTTSIGASAFSSCSKCTLFDFRNASRVPTLANVNAFASTNARKKIVVPDRLYNSWTTASNWSSSTNNIKTSIIRASSYT